MDTSIAVDKATETGLGSRKRNKSEIKVKSTEYKTKIRPRDFVGPLGYLMHQHSMAINTEANKQAEEELDGKNKKKKGTDLSRINSSGMGSAMKSSRGSVQFLDQQSTQSARRSTRSSFISSNSKKMKFGRRPASREKDPGELTKEQLIELMLMKKAVLARQNDIGLSQEALIPPEINTTTGSADAHPAEK